MTPEHKKTLKQVLTDLRDSYDTIEEINIELEGQFEDLPEHKREEPEGLALNEQTEALSNALTNLDDSMSEIQEVLGQ